MGEERALVARVLDAGRKRRDEPRVEDAPIDTPEEREYLRRLAAGAKNPKPALAPPTPPPRAPHKLPSSPPGARRRPVTEESWEPRYIVGSGDAGAAREHHWRADQVGVRLYSVHDIDDICRDWGITRAQLAKWNGVREPLDELVPGKTLRVRPPPER